MKHSRAKQAHNRKIDKNSQAPAYALLAKVAMTHSGSGDKQTCSSVSNAPLFRSMFHTALLMKKWGCLAFELILVEINNTIWFGIS